MHSNTGTQKYSALGSRAVFPSVAQVVIYTHFSFKGYCSYADFSTPVMKSNMPENSYAKTAFPKHRIKALFKSQRSLGVI